MSKQETFMHIQIMQEQIKQLRQQVQRLDEQAEELTTSYDVIDELRDAEPGTEIRLPVASGIFVKATIQETDPVLVNVGSGVALPKTVAETLDILKNQQQEIEALKNEAVAEHDRLIDEFNRLKEELDV